MRILKKIVLVIIFAALIALGALIQVPFRPLIPLSFQVFFLLLAAAILGPLWGTISVALYFLVGLPLIGLKSFFGLPLFTSGQASFETFIESGGGYLWGFLVATLVVGFMVNRREKADFYWILMAMLAGIVIIYALGVTQYLLIAKVPVARILELNVPAIMAADVIKAIFAALISNRLREML